jgi:hypothetical protein
MMKFDDMQNMSDATKNSFDVVTKSTQAIVDHVAEYTRRSFENGTKTMENLLGAKSLEKVVEVQSDYAKTAYDDYVGHATKVGEIYANLAKEAFKPYEGFGAKTKPTK